MFAPIYAAAFDRGIAPTVLDETAPYLVAWALIGRDPDDADGPETPADLMAAYLEREAAARDGRLDAFYEPDRVALS